MSENVYVDVEYLRYDVIVSYKCPMCGCLHLFKPSRGDIYWFIEAGVEVICSNCGAELNLCEPYGEE